MRCALAAGLLWCALAAHAQAPPEAPPPAETQPAATPSSEPPASQTPPAAAEAPPVETARGPAPAARPPAPRTPPAKPPAPQESARNAEAAALRQEVNRLQSELDAERAAALPPPEEAGASSQPARGAWGWLVATALLALGAGFFLGWRVLDRRIRRKYGGLRIY